MKKTKRNLLLETNRRLQETTQKLFMVKQELEKKNKDLKEALKREQHQKEQKEQLKHELAALKNLAARTEPIRPVPGKKLTKTIAEDLSLSYIQLLRFYLDTKDLDKHESLVEEFCQRLIEYNIAPKGIIELHLKAMPQIRTMGGLETKRITFEARMVLLAVMTKYASLLRNQKPEYR